MPPPPQDIDNPHSDLLPLDKDRDRRTPAKKNRISAHLDSTQEEEDILLLDQEDGFTGPSSISGTTTTTGGTMSTGMTPQFADANVIGTADSSATTTHALPTPPLSASDFPSQQSSHLQLGAGTSGSPPHETKIKQISRGVEDLTWKSFQRTSSSGGVGEQLPGEINQEGEENRPLVPPRSPSSPRPEEEQDQGGEQEQTRLARQDTEVEMDHDATSAPTSALPSDKEEAGSSISSISPTVEMSHKTEEGPIAPVVKGVNPPLVEDPAIGVDEHGDEADPTQVPPSATTVTTSSSARPTSLPIRPASQDQNQEQEEEDPPTSKSESESTSPSFPFPVSRGVSGDTDDNDRKRRKSPPSVTLSSSGEGGIKRKLGDRTVSERGVPEERKRAGKRASPPLEERDEDGKRKTNNGTDKVDEESKEETKNEPSSVGSAPKLVCLYTWTHL